MTTGTAHERFRDREPRRPEKPRRVRGGIRLGAGSLDDDALDWHARRWVALVRDASDPDAFQEGLDYARLGQTRSLEVTDAHIRATVQGRRPSAYKLSIDIQRVPGEAWHPFITAMAVQAGHSARLLAGDLPEEIEALAAAHDITLVPAPRETSASCACNHDGPGWCKHACCAAMLVADLFRRDPFMLFTLRGLSGGELLERLRRARVAGSGASLASPRQGGPVDIDTTSVPLEQAVDSFWEAGPRLTSLELPMRRPDVSHPLLRRLGPSPLDGRFPLVGLLATCYDAVSEEVLSRAQPSDSDDAPA